MFLEDRHHFGKIDERAAQTVDLVAHHHVDLPGLDVGKKPQEGRTLHVPARESAVVVPIGHAYPAIGSPVLDELLTDLALVVDAVEVAVQAFGGRLAAIDGAPDRGRERFGGSLKLPFHALAPFRRKKRKPFMCWPVIFLATADSDL